MWRRARWNHAVFAPRRVMLIESLSAPLEFSIRDLVRLGLEVHPYPDAAAALLAVSTENPSLIIVPTDVTGIDILRFVEAVSAWCDIPVIVGLLSSTDSADLAYEALERGARTLLGLPCSAEQLATAVHLWGAAITTLPPPMVVGVMSVDPSAFTVTIDGKPVHFTPREFLILEYLVSEAPRVISVEEIASKFSEADGEHVPAIRSLVSKVRRKLNSQQVGLIESVQGVGYRIPAR